MPACRRFVIRIAIELVQKPQQVVDDRLDAFAPYTSILSGFVLPARASGVTPDLQSYPIVSFAGAFEP